MAIRRLAALLVVAVTLPAVLFTGVGVRSLRKRTTVDRQNVWSIGIYKGPSPLSLSSAAGIENPVLTAEDVDDVKAEFVADPFMVRHDSTWYMFFEVLNAMTGQGDIGLASSSNGLRWHYDRIVLDEPFHLSFPCVVQDGTEYFMVPESRQDRTVRLYRSSSFPHTWVLHDTLLQGDFVDPSLCRYGGLWFLFVCSSAHDTLRLFSAAALEGPWREHPASPIVQGNPHIAQPAGRFVPWKGALLRFAHDDSPTYGRKVYAFTVSALSESTFSEEQSRPHVILAPSTESWKRHGMHHLDPHPLPDGSWIACVDGYRRMVRVSFEY